MEGRRSKDGTFLFGFPKELDSSCLPTKADIVNHVLDLKKVKVSAGEWKNNTPNSQVLEVVCLDLARVWNRTRIPHIFLTNPGYGKQKIDKLLKDAKHVLKTPSERRENLDISEWNLLFDITSCPHVTGKCNCECDMKVPVSWRSFLEDQRGERLERFVGGLDRKNNEREKRTRERNQTDEESLELRRSMWEEEKRQLEPVRDFWIEGSSKDDQEMSDDSDDDDWEDEEAGDNSNKVVKEYNTIKLRRFSRECDRYKLSDRSAAKVANALLKDLSIVTKEEQKLLICPSKLRRERIKWGKAAVEHHNAEVHPGIEMLYFLLCFLCTEIMYIH